MRRFWQRAASTQTCTTASSQSDVTIQSQGNFHKIANHARMNEHIFEIFFGEVAT